MRDYRLYMCDDASIWTDHYFRTHPTFHCRPDWMRRVNKELAGLQASDNQHWDSSVLVAWDADNLSRAR